MNILIAVEDRHRIYPQAIASTLSILRPHLNVVAAEISELDDESRHRQPIAVLCNRPAPTEAGSWLVWVELSLNPQIPTKILWLDGQRSDKLNPGIEDLLEVVDRAVELSAVRSVR